MIQKMSEEELIRKYDPYGEFHLQRQYSTKSRHVFAKAGEPHRWLTVTQTGVNTCEVTQTDLSGRITLRDRYALDGKDLHCVGKERLFVKHGKSLAELLREWKSEEH